MDWEEREGALHKTFEFKNFISAFAWMTALAIEIEKVNHHPEWSNVYNRVVVKLSTHDAGNIVTEKDQKLAAKMDEYYTQYT